ncbi:hypothetical protein [Saprospira grandis]|uniref:Uncharacterized protein n=1 Tax=Saprospira grandis (strain Lewin) TaxID=984262 RepID=H6L649_SAPGL|nr:hypothetical protein [Saprospira grandis]AFC22947.1 hypothetical protein SGRA_0206 [Saprospira grandis str. Lewin]AFC22950.1 hypothetical protein SGRA_0209 [Saprospira grandis str. Lewin]
MKFFVLEKKLMDPKPSRKTTSTQAQPPRKIPSDEGMTIFFLA